MLQIHKLIYYPQNIKFLAPSLCVIICDLCNHDLCEKSSDHPIACRLMPEENEYVSDMTLNLVHPKNIIVTLKRKRP